MGGTMHVCGVGGWWYMGTSVPSAHFCCELKTVPKNKVYLEGRKKILSLKQVYKVPTLSPNRDIKFYFFQGK